MTKSFVVVFNLIMVFQWQDMETKTVKIIGLLRIGKLIDFINIDVFLFLIDCFIEILEVIGMFYIDLVIGNVEYSLLKELGF